MGQCILLGFATRTSGGKFEDWAKANIVAGVAPIPSRGTASWYDWTKANFVSDKQTIPTPSGTSYNELTAWAKENFISLS